MHVNYNLNIQEGINVFAALLEFISLQARRLHVVWL